MPSYWTRWAPYFFLSETITGGSKSKTLLWDLNQRRDGRTLITCQLQLHQLLKTCGRVWEEKWGPKRWWSWKLKGGSKLCAEKKKPLFQILSHEPFHHNSLFKRRNDFGIIPKALTCHYNSSSFFVLFFLISYNCTFIIHKPVFHRDIFFHVSHVLWHPSLS